jgi:hypothetical protein
MMTANLKLRIRIEPEATNRVMEVVADSGGFYRSSIIELDGDRTPSTMLYQFRSLPPGEYQVTATVITANGQRRAVARAQVNGLDSK